MCRAPRTVLGTINTFTFSPLHPLTELNGRILEPGLNKSAELLQGVSTGSYSLSLSTWALFELLGQRKVTPLLAETLIYILILKAATSLPPTTCALIANKVIFFFATGCMQSTVPLKGAGLYNPVGVVGGQGRAQKSFDLFITQPSSRRRSPGSQTTRPLAGRTRKRFCRFPLSLLM